VNGEVTLGPAIGDTPFVVANSGDYYDSVTKADAAYAVEVDSASQYNYVFYPNGQIQVGSLSSSGGIEGRDLIQVAGQASFSMTINPDPDLPSSDSAISIPIYFVPTFSGYCQTVTKTAGVTQTSQCASVASASITDTTTGATQSASADLTDNTGSTENASSSPILQLNVFAGDTIAIDLSTGLALQGHDWWCSVPGSFPTQYYECGGLEGAEGNVSVDPLFEFDQAAFDTEMGANTFNLADNYSFGFSPNIPTNATPEPSSWLLLGTGLLILVPWLRRRLGRA
jgi:hypothetical protein